MYAEEPKVDIDEEWKKFEARHFGQSAWRPRLRVVAAIVGVLMLSGIAFAAIQMVWNYQKAEAQQQAEATAIENRALATASPSLPTDTTTAHQPRVFDNVPLEQLLPEVARHYDYAVTFANEQAKGLRLYFKWNPDEPLEQAVKELNLFEQVNIRQEERTLIVE